MPLLHPLRSTDSIDPAVVKEVPPLQPPVYLDDTPPEEHQMTQKMVQSDRASDPVSLVKADETQAGPPKAPSFFSKQSETAEKGSIEIKTKGKDK